MFCCSAAECLYELWALRSVPLSQPSLPFMSWFTQMSFGCFSALSMETVWNRWEEAESKRNTWSGLDAGPKRRTLNAETGSSNQQGGSSEVHSNKKQSTLYYATTSINFLHVFIVRLSRSVGVSGNFPAWVGVVTGFTSGAELSVPYLYLIHDQSAEGFFRPALSSTYCQFGLLPMAATRPPWSLALCL